MFPFIEAIAQAEEQSVGGGARWQRLSSQRTEKLPPRGRPMAGSRFRHFAPTPMLVTAESALMVAVVTARSTAFTVARTIHARQRIASLPNAPRGAEL